VIERRASGRRRRPYRVSVVALAVLGTGILATGVMVAAGESDSGGSNVTVAATTAPEVAGPPRSARALEPATTELIAGPVMPPAAPVSVRIPAISVSTTAVVGLGLQPDGSMQTPANGDTVGWYTGAPAPGSLGPSVLAAHVDWDGRPGLFYDLQNLHPDDSVIVGRADGSSAEFRITSVEQYPKDRFPTEAVYGAIDHAGLRLITCGGQFDDGRDSYRDNIVAFAELSSTG
jgi:hypothetical protein